MSSPRTGIQTSFFIANQNTCTIMANRHRYDHEVLGGLQTQALDDFTKGLINKRQLLAILHRLDRISHYVSRSS